MPWATTVGSRPAFRAARKPTRRSLDHLLGCMDLYEGAKCCSDEKRVSRVIWRHELLDVAVQVGFPLKLALVMLVGGRQRRHSALGLEHGPSEYSHIYFSYATKLTLPKVPSPFFFTPSSTLP